MSEQALVRSGAELVAVTEHFSIRLFRGAVVVVGLAAVAALALLPLRRSAGDVPWTTPTVVATVLLAAAAPLAARHAQSLLRAVRRHRALELALVLLAAALVAYPLRSELWWPSCALLMLVATAAGLSRALAYCGLVLAANLAAHAVAGDFDDTPAVAILGLWIGLPFWAALAALLAERFAAHMMRLNAARRRAPEPPLRVPSTAAETPRTPARRTDETDALHRLTARQLEVLALMADGLRYDEIAACLSISAQQVQRHVANARERLGVASTSQLLAVVVAAGLAPRR
jgi:DNA-binding CsgD family transcriptional regulator